MAEKDSHSLPSNPLKALLEQKKAIMRLPAPQALDRILEAPHPAALVHSISAEDLYLMIQELGPDDSLPLLPLASDSQVEYIFDITSWRKDRLDSGELIRWVERFLDADSRRFIRWTVDHQIDVLQLLIEGNIVVRIREHDQDPSHFGPEFFTFDEIYYIRILDPADEAAAVSEHPTPGDEWNRRRHQVLADLLRHLADFDHQVYQKVLLEIGTTPPSEQEEEAYRLRNFRLAERGFLPFDTAIGVYQPMAPEVLLHRPPKGWPTASGKSPPGRLVPMLPVTLLNSDVRFSTELARVDSTELLEQIQLEFATLCNQIVVADQVTLGDKTDLEPIVKKVGGYLTIGMDRLRRAADSEENRHGSPGDLLKRWALADIFRVGYGAALNLKWRARRFVASSWFTAQGLPLTFWDETWTGVLGGLMLKRPLYYDNYEHGLLYREFGDPQDIQRTSAILDRIVAVDGLLSLLGTDLAPLQTYGFLTYKNLLLTSWASAFLQGRGILSEQTRLTALTPSRFQTFFKALFGSPSPRDAAGFRRIDTAMKDNFLRWLAGRTTLSPAEIRQSLGTAFESLFEEIETEYGNVSAEALDPRYIQLFLLKKQP